MTCNLKSLLKDRGWTQLMLAKMVNMTTQHISNVALGKKFPARRSTERIAQALGVTVIDIWPDYLTLVKGRSAHMSMTRRKWNPSKAAKRKMQAAIAADKRETKVFITDVNAYPIADGGGRTEFVLRPCAAMDVDIESEVWCQKKAVQLHRYLLNNMAYGCYAQLRRMLADEQNMLDARGLRVVEPRS